MSFSSINCFTNYFTQEFNKNINFDILISDTKIESLVEFNPLIHRTVKIFSLTPCIVLGIEHLHI